MAANSLLDWEGAVNEDVVPYTIDYIRQVENEQLDDSLAYGKDVAHVQNFYRVNITSRDDVKKAVMDYGAVSISYFSDQSSDWSTDNYNSSTAAYYCPNAYTSNHAVTIVGWDDDYSADNFATTPDGNGAWIVRNSWGSYYGKEGYFYLSYYDKSIYTVGYALEAELSDNYDNNYQYDGAMLYGYMGYGGSNKYANIFEAKANQDGSENIKAVSFMTGRSTNLNYTVSIYTNLTDETNPESGTLAAQKSGITTYDGTYTVNLDSPVEINEGNKFSVVVEVRNASGKTSYLAYERSMQSGMAGYWCTASAKENQSFIATPYGYWDDFGKARSCNFIIKAFTDNETQTPVVEVESVSLNKSEMTLTEGESETLAATITPENAENKSITWSSNNEAVATVDVNGNVTAKSAGTAVITATSTNGKSAGCTVTVEKKQIPVTEVRLSESTVGIVEGSTYKLTATVLPENTTDSKNVSWSSSNSEVATVDANGTVTAKRAGTAVITATSTNGKSAGCTVTVSKKEIPITEISLDKSSATLTEGETTTLTATVLPENTTYGKSVKWSSSNVAVATVDLMGKVTAKSAGTAIITATSENGKTASCTVTVNKKDTYTGLRDVDGNWMYFENGNVNSDYAGLVNYEGLWFYVDNGTIDWGYTGLADYNGIWFYVSGGMVDWNYTGLTYYNDVWFYVSGGMINWDYTGLVYYNDIWFYVSGGILDWDYIGLTYYNDIWFVISGGMINWDYAGLIYYNDAWFYVSGGCINWTTAIVDYNGAKFYVQNGMVDWDYTGTVNYNGSTYNVINGMTY